MKMLFTLVTVIFAFNVYADIGLVDRSTAVDGAGNLLSGSVEKFEIMVKNQSGGALEDGDVVIWDVSNDDGYSVTTSTTAGAVPACVLSEACASAALCKCQTYGYKSNVNVDVTNATATAGFMAFISENNAGKVQNEAKASIAGSDVPVGVFYDDAAASGDVEMFIRLR